jgi:predicted small lipoprotein YifL
MKILFAGRFTAWTLLLAGVVGQLSACGQYGDLYLPEDKPAAQTQQQVDKEKALEEQGEEVEQEQQRDVEQPQDL